MAACAQPAGDVQTFDATAALSPVHGFEAVATMRARGAQTPVAVSLRNWIIPNRQRIAEFPERGLLVVQVRAGSLVTIIDGKRQMRGPDEFFTVPPGATLGIETQQDSAIVQIVSLREEQKSR